MEACIGYDPKHIKEWATLQTIVPGSSFGLPLRV